MALAERAKIPFNKGMRALIVGIFLLAFSLAYKAEASRIPNSLNIKNYVSKNGFSLSVEDTSWVRSEIRSKNSEIAYRMEKNTDGSPLLTVRTDQTDRTSLKSYVKTWLGKYSQFGLVVLGYKFFKLNAETPGFIADIINPDSNKQTRQVVFYKNNKAVVINCIDQNKTFSDSLKSCNDVIRTFRWIENTKS